MDTKTIIDPKRAAERGLARRRCAPAGGSAALLAALVLMLAPAALAGPKPRQTAAPYDVTVWAIRATRSNKTVSPELRSIARELRKRFKYTGFVLEKKKSAKVAAGRRLDADLIGTYRARVTPVGRKNGRVTLKLEVLRREGKKDKRLVGTTVTIRQGRSQLLGGWRVEPKRDDVLIIAVSAR